jgi:hypothetical protein
MTATGLLQTIKARFGDVSDAYSLALELRTGRTGDGTGAAPARSSNDRTINDAVTQVLRGVGGLADYFAQNRAMTKSVSTITFVPVVVTTAELWASDARLEAAELATGHLSKGSVRLTRKEFLAYQYAASPDLRPVHPARPGMHDLSEVLAAEYLRTVFVVSPEALEPFLSMCSDVLT